MNHQRWCLCHVSSGVPFQWPLVDAGFTLSLHFLPFHGKFFQLYLWFYGNITHICEIRTVKIKKQTKKKNYSHIFSKIVSVIALQICKNCYLSQGKGKRIEKKKKWVNLTIRKLICRQANGFHGWQLPLEIHCISSGDRNYKTGE